MKPYRSLLPLSAPLLILAAIIQSCASMGRPTGGPRDEDPPVFLYSNPAPGQLNVSSNRLRIYFNENVQIQDPMEKVVVSPVQKTPPAVSANGRYVQVEFRDTLVSDVTYTIDFADAIRDLNEGNILDGFATDFATGGHIDSLRISGMVLQASNLEPAQGMIVGVYSVLDDSAITTLPFERITKTNQLGQFTVRNLKPGSYHIFAVNDVNRDYHWDRSEDIAFYDTIITPTANRVEVADTLLSSEGTDSVVTRWVTAYEPNDILLTWFNENYRSQYLSKYERPDRRRLHFEFGAPSDSFPVIRTLSGELAGTSAENWSVMTSSLTRDTIDYWISDTLVSGLDSLLIEARYLRTDTADRLSWTTDTLRMFMRGNSTRKAELKKKAEEEKKWAEALKKGDTIPEPKVPALPLSLDGTTAEVYRPVNLTAGQPVVSFDTAAVRFEIKVDTLWEPAPTPRFFNPQPLNPTTISVDVDWEPGATYRLSIDSAALVSPWGTVNAPFSEEFKVRKLDEYSSITFLITDLPDSVRAYVEILSKQDTPVDKALVDSTGTAFFEFLRPSDYYARLFIDANRNGKYDEGNLAAKIQPEEVYYYPKKIKLKQNWDISQDWRIFELPLDLQKPSDIKKNKPARKPGEMNDRDRYYDDEEYDEDEENFGTNFYDQFNRDNFDNRRSRNNNRSNNYNRNNSFRNSGFGF
ncbi:MAG: Ig-like domain-containing protein [Clostridium sp.]|nr:Ig-like domain-containing protein [Clostridium sp.]